MSRKKPIKITIEDNLEVSPDGVYESEVVKSGNGAVVKFYKRFLGEKVLVVVKSKIKTDIDNEEEFVDKWYETDY